MSQTQVERLFIADRPYLYAQIFRQSTGNNVSGAFLTANWESEDTSGTGQLGSTLVTVSSGVFSFVKTGLYRVTATATGYLNNDSRYAGCQIISCSDGSTFNLLNAYGYNSIFSSNSENRYAANTVHTIMDVTDTTNQKVKMYLDAENTVTWSGATSQNATYIMFEYLGAT